ncbi:MAG: biopolymer transporter ExbD [Lachnospiraceae bacterium]|nr:biopolymer transporter ExbD [Lachnospiraceae bacterium]
MREGRKRSEVTMDLTSMLDVVFIVLIVFLCNMKVANEMAIQEPKTAEEYHWEAYEGMDEYVYFMNITCSLEESTDWTKRRLEIYSGSPKEEGENADFSMELTPENEEEVYGALEAYLREEIQAATLGTEPYEGVESAPRGELRPVILSLNREDETLLYRDEVAIGKIVEELCDEYENLFWR